MASRRLFLALTVLLLTPGTAAAYGGPGSIIPGIGALIATIAAIGAALFGFFWFPMKRLVRKLKGDREATSEEPGPVENP